MADRPFGWERFLAAAFILITLAALVWLPNFSNADISFPTLVIVLLALLASIAGKHDDSR